MTTAATTTAATDRPMPATPRIALVTGASKGIGRATATRLSTDGYQVVLVARSEVGLHDVARSCPGPTLVIPADITDKAAVERIFRTVESEWGSVDILVCNAGAGLAAPLVDTSDEDLQGMLDLNLIAPFRCIRRALPAMVEQRWGRIVVISSVVAKRGERLVSAYSASKHAALGLVRSAASEVAGDGVTVNAICPGYVDTEMTDLTVSGIAERTGRDPADALRMLARQQPIGRLIDPSEVADAVALCVGNGAITGQGINVDGGAVQS